LPHAHLSVRPDAQHTAMAVKELKAEKKAKRTLEEKEAKAAKKAKKEEKAAKAAKAVEEPAAAEAADTKAEKKAKKEKKEKKEKKIEEPAPVEEAVVCEPAAEEEEEEEETTFKVHKKEAPKPIEDKTINCKDCKKDFVFEATEQEFFKSKGFDPATKVRCRECTKAKKARFNGESGGDSWGQKSWDSKGPTKCYNCGNDGHMSRECSEPKKAQSCYNCGKDGHMSRECSEAPKERKQGGGVCFAFQKGSCSRGDTCKFSHSSA